MKVTVEVTQEDMDSHRPLYCPVTKAIGRAGTAEVLFVTVGWSQVLLSLKNGREFIIRLPKEAELWLEAWDTDLASVKPFTFELEVAL